MGEQGSKSSGRGRGGGGGLGKKKKKKRKRGTEWRSKGESLRVKCCWLACVSGVGVAKRRGALVGRVQVPARLTWRGPVPGVHQVGVVGHFGGKNSLQ